MICHHYFKQGVSSMKRINDHVLDTYRMQLKHYFEKGLGAESELSYKTIITPQLVKITLDRYLELGGTLDFISVKEEEYQEFLEEVKAC
tara:strand:+ start:2000 stop:2266 length:267 start_codon:yes stop_codon:yes gene_type:complete